MNSNATTRKILLQYFAAHLDYCCNKIFVYINISLAADSVLSLAGKYFASTEKYTLNGNFICVNIIQCHWQ